MRFSVRVLLTVFCLCGAVAISACGSTGHATTAASTPGPSSTSNSTPARSVTTPAHTVTQPSLSHRHSPLMSIVEDDNHVGNDPNGTLAAYKAMGAQAVRYNVHWSYLVKDASSTTKPASFNAASPNGSQYYWAELDTIDHYASVDGLQLFLTLTSPAPRWAVPKAPAKINAVCGVNHCQQYEPSAADFAQFVEAIGKRYSGHYIPPGQSTPLPRISFWSLWNEPNYGPNLAPQSTTNAAGQIVDTAAPQYRKLVEAGWNALAATGHTPSSDKILIGETAPRGEIDPGVDNMTPTLQFLRDLYCVNADFKPLTGSVASALGCPTSGSTSSFVSANPALFKATGWANHPYPDGVAPAVKAGGTSISSEWADFARLSNLTTALNKVSVAYGSNAQMPIYNTEFGYFTTPPGTHPDSVNLATAARYDDQAEYLSWKNPQVASYDQYLLRDPAPNSGSVFDTGLEFYTGKAKQPVLDAFRVPLWLPVTQAGPHQPLEVWGCARPALQTGAASAKVAIEFKAGAGSYRTIKVVTVHTAGADCYFDTTAKFPSSGTVRLSVNDGAFFSRTQAITLK